MDKMDDQEIVNKISIYIENQPGFSQELVWESLGTFKSKR